MNSATVERSTLSSSHHAAPSALQTANGHRLLTPQELSHYQKHGFLSIPALAQGVDVLEARRIIDEVYAKQGRPWGYIDKLLELAPELRSTRVFESCLAIAKQLLGRTAMHGHDGGIYKEPHGKNGTPWHQDGAFHRKYFPNNTVAFWIPLQDVTLENGCMQYIPLRRKQILLPHRPYYPNDLRSMTTDGVDASQAVDCPLRTGDATVHGPLTLHSAWPNRTASIRRTWVLTFRPWGKWGFFAPTRFLHQARILRNQLRWLANN